MIRVKPPAPVGPRGVRGLLLASLAVAVAAAWAGTSPAPGSAQDARRAPPAAGGALWAVEAVRVSVADRWGVDAATVIVELGTLSGEWPPAGAREVSLVGTGAGGHWVARTDVSGDAGVRVRAGVEAEVPVAARDLPRGVELEERDLARGVEIRWGPPQGSGPGAQPGWRTLRPVAKGEALRPPAAQPPPAVAPGDPVELVWARGGVAVRGAGVAAGAAPLGGEVAVRTRDGRRLVGVAVAPGVVDVTQGRR